MTDRKPASRILKGAGIGLAAAGLLGLSTWLGVSAHRHPDLPLDNFLVAEIDAHLQMPVGARPAAEYIRHYAVATPKTEEDLPFTTLAEPPRVPWGAPVVLGVFVQRGTGDLWGIKGEPRAIVVPDAKKLPSLVHGGCSVVNVVIDPRTARTLGSWCNVDDRSPDQRPSRVRAR